MLMSRVILNRILFAAFGPLPAFIFRHVGLCVCTGNFRAKAQKSQILVFVLRRKLTFLRKKRRSGKRFNKLSIRYCPSVPAGAVRALAFGPDCALDRRSRARA